MTDRELLELVAKAAGYKIRFSDDGTCFRVDNDWTREWNPSTDDGDALRLAIKLRMHIEPWNGEPRWVRAIGPTAPGCADEPLTGDEMEATRRAIFRAAVAMALFDAGFPERPEMGA